MTTQMPWTMWRSVMSPVWNNDNDNKYNGKYDNDDDNYDAVIIFHPYDDDASDCSDINTNTEDTDYIDALNNVSADLKQIKTTLLSLESEFKRDMESFECMYNAKGTTVDEEHSKREDIDNILQDNGIGYRRVDGIGYREGVADTQIDNISVDNCAASTTTASTATTVLTATTASIDFVVVCSNHWFTTTNTNTDTPDPGMPVREGVMTIMTISSLYSAYTSMSFHL